MVCFLFSLSVHLAPDWTMESCNESVSPLETRCLSCPRFLSERDKASAKSGGTNDTHWLLSPGHPLAIRPLFRSLNLKDIFWSFNHFQDWNEIKCGFLKNGFVTFLLLWESPIVTFWCVWHGFVQSHQNRRQDILFPTQYFPNTFSFFEDEHLTELIDI